MIQPRYRFDKHQPLPAPKGQVKVFGLGFNTRDLANHLDPRVLYLQAHQLVLLNVLKMGGLSKLIRRLSQDRKRRGSLDTTQLEVVESRLTEKTDFIDELSTVWPLDIRAPGIIVVGSRGAGKSTLLETLTGTPFPHGNGISTRRPIKVRIVADPTCISTHAFVSIADPLCKESAQRVSRLEDLGKVLNRVLRPDAPRRASEEIDLIFSDEDMAKPIYVKVVRPAGAAYNVIDLPGLDEQTSDMIEKCLREESQALILVVLPVQDVFDRPNPILLAKKVDPSSKRTIGVVTKMDLVDKEMCIVEKLQMTSQRELNLPLGYVAVRCASLEGKALSLTELLDQERNFFTSNALLSGLRPDRWSTDTLKKLIINFQCNAIAQSVPEASKCLHDEVEALKRTVQDSGKRIEDHQEFFTKLCADTTAMAFAIEELATSSVTRSERLLNLGARLNAAMRYHEDEARRSLPASVAGKVGPWLERDDLLSDEPRIYVSRETLYHDIFSKSVREVCGPVLRNYALVLLEDVCRQLREVSGALIVERFSGFPWLMESLKSDVSTLLSEKKTDAEGVLERLVSSELSWTFVTEADLNAIERDVAMGMSGKHGKVKKPLDALGFASELADTQHALYKQRNYVIVIEEETMLSCPPSGLFQTGRECRIRELALDAYVRLMLRRVFYAVPMNIRNLLITEFRKDIVGLVAERYNDENKLRTVMSEEIWLGQLREYRIQRHSALTGVLQKIDRLS